MDAWNMLMLKIQKLHITEGILISEEKRMEIKEREEEERRQMSQDKKTNTKTRNSRTKDRYKKL